MQPDTMGTYSSKSLLTSRIPSHELILNSKNQFSFTSQGAAVAGYARIGNLQDQVQGSTFLLEDRSLSCVSVQLFWWMLLQFGISAKVMMMAFTIYWNNTNNIHGILFLEKLEEEWSFSQLHLYSRKLLPNNFCKTNMNFQKQLAMQIFMLKNWIRMRWAYKNASTLHTGLCLNYIVVNFILLLALPGRIFF